MNKKNVHFWVQIFKAIASILMLGFMVIALTMIVLFSEGKNSASWLLYLVPFFGLIYMNFQINSISRLENGVEDDEEKPEENEEKKMVEK